MKIGIFNTFDSNGGAARTALRLHRGLIKKGVNSKMQVQMKQSDEHSVTGPYTKFEKLRTFLFSFLNGLPLLIYRIRLDRSFSTGWLNSFNLRKFENSFDIINLHWIANGFLSINSIKNIRKPVVLSLHDSWYFTGGCHVPYTCTKYIYECGSCEVLNSNIKYDLSYFILNRKKNVWANKKLVLVAASNWIADCAKKSSIFKNHRIEVINPGLDLEVFKPHNKTQARKLFNFSDNENIILFGAISATSDPNKGFHLLMPALEKIKTLIPNLQLVVFGASDSGKHVINSLIPTRYVGKLHDDLSLSLLYSAADLMIVPSIQEAFGQTASESFACGTPVVAFRTSGLVDIIDHKVNGFLAEPYDTNDLAEGIRWFFSDKERIITLSKKAREKAVSNFSIDKCVNDYISLYNSILNS